MNGLNNGIGHVLVVDDDEQIQWVVTQGLGKAGFTSAVASDGRAGLAKLLADDFDVIVVDLKMSPMDGLTFLEEAQKIRPWLSVIIITGTAGPPELGRLEELGVTDIINKPFGLEALVERVKEKLAAGKHVARSFATDSRQNVQHELTMITQMTQAAMATDSLQEGMRTFCEGIADSLDCVSLGMLSLESRPPSVFIYHQHPFEDAQEAHIVEGLKRYYYRMEGVELDPNMVVEVFDASGGTTVTDPGVFEPVPVICESTFAGVLFVVGRKGQKFSKSELSFLCHAAHHLSTVQIAFRRMHELAVRDPLTRLYNRGYIVEQLRHLCETAHRYDQPFGVIILDIDHFKETNDSHGHLAGDRLLQQFSEIACVSMRKADIIGRYGGDEFLLLLPMTRADGIALIGHRIVESIRAAQLADSDFNGKLTVSAGGVAVEPSVLAVDSEVVLSRADDALYVAKASGRDQFVMWTVGLTQAPPIQDDVSEWATTTKDRDEFCYPEGEVPGRAAAGTSG